MNQALINSNYLKLDSDATPDDLAFEIREQSTLIMPSSTVVYRTPKTTEIISTFKDDKWRIGPARDDVLSFTPITCEHHKNTVKTLMYILAFYPALSKVQIPAPKTLKGYLTALGFISRSLIQMLGQNQPYLQFFYDIDLQTETAEKATSLHHSIETMSNQRKTLDKSTEEYKTLSSEISKLNKLGVKKFGLDIIPIINRLHSIGSERLGFEIKISPTLTSLLTFLNTNKEENKGQHPVIPPDVYSKLFSNSLAVVQEFLDSNFEESAQRLLDHVNDLVNTGGSGNGFAPAANRKGYTNRLVRFLGTPKTEADLKERAKYEWDYSRSNLAPTITTDSWFYGCENRNDISDRINIVRLQAYWLILIQGGMREQEAITLPYGPLKPVKATKDSLAYILGWTTKYTGGSQGRWVLGDAGQKAHEALFRLAQFIYKFNANDDSVERKYLFINTKLSVGDKGQKLDNQTHITPTGFTHTTRAKQGERDKVNRVEVPSVSERDLAFLQQYSLASKVDWHKVSLGEPWPLTAHQYRRSFVFYSLATGLVTVAGAKRQLHHLSKSITEYYGNQDGNHMLQQFFTDKESQELVSTEKSIVNTMAYLDAITSGKPLKGAAGLNTEKHLNVANANTPEKRMTYAKNNKDILLKQAKEGRLKVTVTPLGMCTSTLDCDSYALGQSTACLSCMNAIHDPEKISAAKKILEEQKKQSNDWMETRIIEDQLSEFDKYDKTTLGSEV